MRLYNYAKLFHQHGWKVYVISAKQSGEKSSDEFDFNGEDEEDDVVDVKKNRKKEVKPKDNITLQDFGLPPASYSSDEEEDNIENI